MGAPLKSSRHTKLSITQFHRLVQVPATGDELPRGPTGGSDGLRTRKWVSKYDGTPIEVSEVSGSPRANCAAPLTAEAFKEALDYCIDEYLNGFDAHEAVRCIGELQASGGSRHARSLGSTAHARQFGRQPAAARARPSAPS